MNYSNYAVACGAKLVLFNAALVRVFLGGPYTTRSDAPFEYISLG